MPLPRLLASALCGALAATTLTLASPSSGDAAEPSSASAPRAAGAGRHTLLAGHALVARTQRSSLHNGWYSLDVEPGDVTLYEAIPLPGSQGTSSVTTGTWFRQDPTGRFHAWRDHTVLRLRPTGDLTLVTSRGKRLWHSDTAGSGAVRLTLHRSGKLALHKKSGKVVWSSRSGQVQMSGGMVLRPGDQLRDAWETAFLHGDVVTLTMQRNGNLVHRCGSSIDWQTHTDVRRSTLRMSRGGLLRVVTPGGRTVWSSHSGGHDYAWFNGSRLTIEAFDVDQVWYAHTDWRACG